MRGVMVPCGGHVWNLGSVPSGSQLCRRRLLVALFSVWARLATLSPSAPRCSFLGSAQARNSVAVGSSLLFSRFGSGLQLCRLRLLVALFSVRLRFATLSPPAPRCSFLGSAQVRNSVASGSSLLYSAQIERRLTETDADGRTSNNNLSHHQQICKTE